MGVDDAETVVASECEMGLYLGSFSEAGIVVQRNKGDDDDGPQTSRLNQEGRVSRYLPEGTYTSFKSIGPHESPVLPLVGKIDAPDVAYNLRHLTLDTFWLSGCALRRRF